MTMPMNNNGNDRLKKSKAVEMKAHWLADKFNSPDSYGFYCKAIYQLGESRVDQLVAVVSDKKPRNPGAYFNILARKEFKDD
jgi:hypothetical protein